jgi:meso-butanediol dehydrogenase/(S,S)-butanediol dehydrogenase/diacetyl reductase
MVETMIPLKRPQTPDDMANAAMFLCSDEAWNITGQTLSVCGGYYMGY